MKFQARLVMVLLVGAAVCQGAKLDSLYNAPGSRGTSNNFGGHNAGLTTGFGTSSGFGGQSTGLTGSTGFQTQGHSNSIFRGNQAGFSGNQAGFSGNQAGFGGNQAGFSGNQANFQTGFQNQGHSNTGFRGNQAGFSGNQASLQTGFQNAAQVGSTNNQLGSSSFGTTNNQFRNQAGFSNNQAGLNTNQFGSSNHGASNSGAVTNLVIDAILATHAGQTGSNIRDSTTSGHSNNQNSAHSNTARPGY